MSKHMIDTIHFQSGRHGVLRRAMAALMIMLCVVPPGYPQIVADPNAGAGKRPVVDNTANGRPLVQIATPSAAGVSHNQYSQFNVGPNGAILNNARDVVLTQQGGYVGANPNLQGGAARVILNEVTSTSPSQLRGYTEVAGQRAEVIIANPNGISCDGCGFINTSRGVLTTGVPLFGGNGSLEAFRVSRGAIQIGSGGLNGANTDQLDLIARSVQVNGELWGNRLNLVTGANRVNYGDLGLSVIAGEGNAPTIGVDVARMGGMYAQKIMLVGTENGVGVRSLGTLAAQAGSFTLSSQGQIALSGKTSASDDIVLKSAVGTSNDGVLYAGRNAQLQGGVIENAGTLSAQGNLDITAAQLRSTGTLAAGVDQAGNVAQAGNLTVTASGDVLATGVNRAGADLQLSGTKIDLSHSSSSAGRKLGAQASDALTLGGATVETLAGDLELGGATITLDGAKLTSSADARINAVAGLSNRGGEITSAGGMNVTAASVDNSAGMISAATGGAGVLSLRSAGSISNGQGRIAAGAALNLAAASIQGQGSVIANGDATLSLQSLNNEAGSLIQSNRDLRITTSGATGNQGALKAIGALNLTASQIDNAAGGDISAAATTLQALNGDINNAGKIGGNTIATTSNALNNQGSMIGGDVTINADRLNNSGAAAAIAATNSVQAFVRSALTNQDNALIYSLGKLVIAADATQSAAGDYLHRTGTLTNSSATIEAGGDLAVSADTIVNKRSTLVIARDIFDGTESWQKYNYYWRSWGSGMSGPDSAGLMAAVTRTLPFNDASAFGSRYGSILQLDLSSNRALVQFQGSNQLWVSYKAIKQNADGSYDMTFYEGKNCDGSTLCPYQQMVWREYTGSRVQDQFDPSRYTSPAELKGIGTNGESAYDFRERSYNGSNYHDAITAMSDAAKLNASGRITINTAALTNDASDIIAGGALTINGANGSGASGGVVNNIGYSINRTAIGTAVDHYDRHVGHHTYTTLNLTEVTALQTIDANIQSNQAVSISAQNLNNTTVGAATVPTRAGGVGHANITLPAGGLFTVRPEPGQRYLVETDRRFTDYKTFLGSDYMLGRLTMDPSMTQKRLGDGFYEQKLINDQIAQLTGKKFLDGYTNAEAQYKALMDSGVASAASFKLTPGIALSADQMAALTSDIVWMVDTEVTLADGSRQHALVPTVYLAHGGSATLQASGALIGGRDVTLAADTVNNSGIVRAEDKLAVAARDINNTGGELRGDKVDVLATETLNIGTDFQNYGRQGSVTGRQVSLAANDINIIGAKIKADDTLKLAAQNNLTIAAATAQHDVKLAWSGAGEREENHGMMRNGGVTAQLQQALGSTIEAGGDASFAAGRNIAVRGSSIDVKGNAALLAGGSVEVSAVKTATDSVVTGRSDRYDLNVVGHTENLTTSQIAAGKGLSIVASGQNGSGDITLAASRLSSKEGEVTLNAAGDISIGAMQKNNDNRIDERGGKAWMKTHDSSSVAAGSLIEGEKGVNLIATGRSDGKVSVAGSDIYSNGTIAIQAKGDVTVAETRSSSDEWQQAHSESRGFLSRSSSDRTDQVRQDMANGSTLSGNKVVIDAGRNIAVRGSEVVSTELTSLRAANDVSITTTQNFTEQSHYKEDRKSGLMGAGFGISIGSQGQMANGNGSSVTNNASTVGSVNGNVNIIAGNAFRQIGSQVVAPQGDINILAKSVDIGAAYDASVYTQENKFKQSGLTLAINSPVISVLQTGQQLIQAGQKTPDKRMQALAAATLAKNAYDAGAALIDKPTDTTGVKITLSLGSSQSSNKVTQASSQAVGSTVAAGGAVNIVASGGPRSDINVVGSAISAGGDVSLVADHEINLLAAQSAYSQHGNNNSSGASIGIGFAMGGSQNGFTLELGANRARGNLDGDDLVNKASTISAGNQASLISGGDTNVRGSTVSAKTVAAAIGGDLNIESLQDKSTYGSKQSSAGVGLSLCIPPFCYGASSVSGSLSGSKAKGDYQSVVTQAGIKAGDGGYHLIVAGNTDLKGAVIASTAKASEDGKNLLQTGSLTFSDVRNHDSYEASGYSVGGSLSGKLGDQGGAQSAADKKAASDKENPTGPGGSPGYSSAEGSQESITRSGVSAGAIVITDSAAQKAANGMDAQQVLAAINRDVDSSKDGSGKLTKSWDGDALRQQVEAEARIVQAFGQTAAKAVGDFAHGQEESIKEKLRKSTSAEERAQLETELANWGEGGVYRVAAHTAIGALAGGLQGALGAAASAQLMPTLAAEIGKMGLPLAVEKVVSAATAAAIGAAVGDAAGAAMGMTVELNNRQLHPDETAFIKRKASEYAAKNNISIEQAERELMRGALYANDEDWQTAFKTYTPEEIVRYQAAAAYLKVQATLEGFTFTNLEGYQQAAFTSTTSQFKNESYLLRQAFSESASRALYADRAAISLREMSFKNGLSFSGNAVIGFGNGVPQGVADALKAYAALVDPATYSKMVDAAKSMAADPAGTMEKLAGGLKDGAQDALFGVYLDWMQKDSKDLGEMAGKIFGSTIVDLAAQASGVKLASVAADLTDVLKPKIAQAVKDLLGPSGRYVDARFADRVVTTDISQIGMEWGKGVKKQGMPFEDYIASTLPSESRLPPNFKTFDFFDGRNGLATSVKTLDTTTAAKLANPQQVYSSLKSNIDATLKFTSYTLDGRVLSDLNILQREVIVAVPSATTPLQWEQINKAMSYAAEKGVSLKISIVKS
ncbi:filamentous hemagglutinin [Herbaspirillum seropedicae]|uniref:two-partner secretion domain-containing protein n=1 Tax=Herbaspirillum seropedicae TaxID=964 RepID=UPI0033916A0A